MGVRLTVTARLQLLDLNEPMLSRITAVLERRGNWPAVSGAKPLRGQLGGARAYARAITACGLILPQAR